LRALLHHCHHASFLIAITDKAERKLCFELAESVGLDIASITKTVVENIRGKDDFKMQEDSALEAATSEVRTCMSLGNDALLYNACFC
jgi:hypothetical protein